MLRSIPGISRKHNLSLLSSNLVKYLESKLFNWSKERWERFASNKRLCNKRLCSPTCLGRFILRTLC